MWKKNNAKRENIKDGIANLEGIEIRWNNESLCTDDIV